MNKVYVQVEITLLLLMFIILCGDKIFTFGKSEAEELANKLHIKLGTSQLCILFAGILQFIFCAILLYGIWSLNSYSIHFGTISLTILSIIVTLIFYTFPFKKLPFLCNLVNLCNLILLSYICLNDN